MLFTNVLYLSLRPQRGRTDEGWKEDVIKAGLEEDTINISFQNRSKHTTQAKRTGKINWRVTSISAVHVEVPPLRMACSLAEWHIVQTPNIGCAVLLVI